MKPHSFINVVIPFRSVLSDTVNAVITGFADPVRGNYPAAANETALSSIKGLHYMTISVAEPTCPSEIDCEVPANKSSRKDEPAHLLMEISSDCGAQEMLADLAQKFGPRLLELLQAADLEKTPATLLAFLLEHRLVIGDTWGSTLGQTFTGSPGLTVERILGERKLAESAAAVVERLRKGASWEKRSPRQRLDQVRSILWTDPSHNWKWAFVPDPAPCLGPSPDETRSPFNPQIWKVAGTIFHKLMWPLYLPLLLTVLAAFVYAWCRDDLMVAFVWANFVAGALITGTLLVVLGMLLRLRYLERTDAVEDLAPSSKHGEELLEVENFGGQNHLASVSRLKPGLLRSLTLRLAFILVGTGRFVCAPGFLGKNGVIHFARWMRLPNTNQLLFWSNYDDSWESYVADFIADSPTGVTGIWSNCVGFPRTRGLFGGGAADRDRLVRWARRQQQPTRFWFAAYRNLTAARIRINAAIRQGLATAESQQDCHDWLTLFGSSPRPADSLNIPEIPSLVFGGMSSLRFSTCFVVTLGADDVPKAKEWLRTAVLENAAYGELPYGQELAIVAGVSGSGLPKLGIPPESWNTFPVAFKQGMHTPARARELGDLPPNDPDNWWWGNMAKVADVFLVIYGVTEKAMTDSCKTVRDSAARLGHKVCFEQALTQLADPNDPHSVGISGTGLFGFKDGISQPIIRAAPRWNTRQHKNQLVEAGELVLGYPDNLGVIPPVPTVPDGLDPWHMLADAGTDALRKRPEFSSYEGRGCRDLGLDGTFLVVRQLDQNIDETNKWFGAAFQKVLDTPGMVVTNYQTGDDALTTTPGHIKLRGLDFTGYAKPAPPADQHLASGALSTAASALDMAPPSVNLAPIILPTLKLLKHIEKMILEMFTAKMVGRWKDGTSLVRNRQPPPSRKGAPLEPDNDFLLGEEDPSGLSCPFGAHIRRANPRDTRFPGSMEEIASVNRHRMLRVGRVYGALDANNTLGRDQAQGLMFMCLNSDIERQFEFVQKTWLLNPNIHGLANEVDPIIGHGPRKFTIPTTSGPLPLPPLPDFVTVVGGGYFFLPSKTVLTFLATDQA